MKDKLEIIIPTYNRIKNLKESLAQLLDENSPVKECKITILDNCSEDETQIFCNELSSKYKNINYIRHGKNIGMGTNICRGMEIASLPYYWLVGDDDNYDFSNWQEVVQAINDDADCIVVSDFTLVDSSVKSIISQLGLLSAGIYKTSNVTSEVLQNAHANIINMFPHMALICELVNNNKTFKITSKPIALWGVSNPDPEGKAYIRGAKLNNDIMPRLKFQFLIPAWFNCLQMIKDEKLKSNFINNTCKFSKLSKNISNFVFYKSLICDNRNLFNNYYQNTLDIFIPLNFKNKILYLIACIMVFIQNDIYKKQKDEKYTYIKFLCFKFKRKRMGKIFKHDNSK